MSILKAQDEILPFSTQGHITTEICFQTWKSSNNVPLNQFSMPISLVVPLGKQFYFSLTNTPAYSWWYDDFKIGGISDSWFQGIYIFEGEKVMINLGFGMPTGNTRLDTLEYKVIQDLSRNIFRYKLPYYGQGLTVKGGIACAYPLFDGLVVGFGAQYKFHDAYFPLSFTYGGDGAGFEETWEMEFRPGDEVLGHVGLDWKLGDDFKIMLDGCYTYYWADKLQNDLGEYNTIYSSGDKITLNLGLFYRFDEKFIWSHFIYRQKGKDERLQGTFIEEEEYNSNGNQFEFDILYKALEFENGSFYVKGEARYFAENDVGIGKEMVFGGGPGLNINISNNLLTMINFRYLLGSAWIPDHRTLNGMYLSAGVKYLFNY
jgi:hypothetical protein